MFGNAILSGVSRYLNFGSTAGSAWARFATTSSTGTFAQIKFTDGTVQTTAPVSISSFSNMAVFSSSGTFTVPSGITKVKATVIGGGGGAASNSGAGGGGGGGGTGIDIISGLVPGASIVVTVGAGGAAYASGNGSAVGGGSSSFGAYVSATGGGGAVTSSAFTSYSAAPGIGGIGSGSLLNIAGDAGSSQSGGSTFMGAGGLGAVAGRAYGGGGGATAGFLAGPGRPWARYRIERAPL